MKCPACKNELQKVIVEDVTVDVCKGGCGGIWFDQFELSKFDEPHEATGEELLNIQRDINMSVDHTKRLSCPSCTDTVMMRHFFSVKRKVEVDECPMCGGFWLDCGELGQIRQLYNTEEDRNEAFKQYFDATFGEELAKMKAESEEKNKKARKIAHIFRFICPNYYISGKQDWGAF